MGYQKPPPPPKPDTKDESKYVWKDYKPGFEINQHGHIRTKNYQPPPSK